MRICPLLCPSQKLICVRSLLWPQAWSGGAGEKRCAILERSGLSGRTWGALAPRHYLPASGGCRRHLPRAAGGGRLGESRRGRSRPDWAALRGRHGPSTPPVQCLVPVPLPPWAARPSVQAASPLHEDRPPSVVPVSDPGRPGSCGSCRHALRFVKTESGSTSPLASLIHHDLLRFLHLALYTDSFLLLSAQCPSSASSHRTRLPRCRVLSRTGFQLPWFKQHLSPLMTQAAVCGSHSRCPLMALCREGRRAPAGLVSPRVIFVVLKHLLF